jgi:hypothetical protein
MRDYPQRGPVLGHVGHAVAGDKKLAVIGLLDPGRVNRPAGDTRMATGVSYPSGQRQDAALSSDCYVVEPTIQSVLLGMALCPPLARIRSFEEA